jgi:hypothetical protein
MKFLAATTALLLAVAAFVSAAPLNQATVTRVVNQVEVIPSGAQPSPASLGEIIRGRTGVRTGRNSRAQLTFADQTLARLGANTLFSFERGTRSLDLENGSILLQVPKDAGGATIRSAPVVAAITGTTVMMEYSPGNPGTVKLIVLEGTVRLSLPGRLGESVLVGPGQMIAVAANARALPDPVTVDVKRILKTSKLVKEGDLESMGLIMETVETQQQLLADNKLTEAPPDLLSQQQNNPNLINSTVANAIQNRQDTVVQPVKTFEPFPQPTPPVPQPTPPVPQPTPPYPGPTPPYPGPTPF